MTDRFRRMFLLCRPILNRDALLGVLVDVEDVYRRRVEVLVKYLSISPS